VLPFFLLPIVLRPFPIGLEIDLSPYRSPVPRISRSVPSPADFNDR
jgi:hypothetical protein